MGLKHFAEFFKGEDFFKFTLTSKSYVEVFLNNIPTDCWYNMEVYSGTNEDDFLHGAYQDATTKQFNGILNAGTYYIRIYSKNQAYYDEDEYKISLNYCKCF